MYRSGPSNPRSVLARQDGLSYRVPVQISAAGAVSGSADRARRIRGGHSMVPRRSPSPVSRRAMTRLVTACSAVLGVAVFAVTVISAQSGTRSYTAPRTPWGDPDLQGTYTNSNESGIPMARPAEFAGRRPESITPEEMARLMKQRASRIEESAETIGATTENNTG